jgi:hypothetical protein
VPREDVCSATNSKKKLRHGIERVCSLVGTNEDTKFSLVIDIKLETLHYELENQPIHAKAVASALPCVCCLLLKEKGASRRIFISNTIVNYARRKQITRAMNGVRQSRTIFAGPFLGKLYPRMSPTRAGSLSAAEILKRRNLRNASTKGGAMWRPT